MSIFFREERRATTTTEGLAGGASRFFGGGHRTMKRSLSLIPVYSATSYIAESLSTLPLAAYKVDQAGNRTLSSPPPRLVMNPNTSLLQGRIEWLHQCAVSMKLRGNAYGLVTDLDANGVPARIHWLNPENVKVDESGPVPVYRHNREKLDLSTLVHIPDYTLPGSVVGLSPIEAFRTQIDMGLSAQEFGESVYRSSGMPSGHLKNSERTLNAEQATEAKEKFKSAVARNDVFVSGKDWQYDKIGLSLQDMQFLESVKATANQVAAIYKVPPEDIGGESGGSLTYSTVELNQIRFIQRCVQPLAAKLEAALNRLLPVGQYVKFNLNANIRADLKSRMDAYKVGLEIGAYTLAEVRALEDQQMLTDNEIKQWQSWYGKQSRQGAQEARAIAREGADHGPRD